MMSYASIHATVPQKSANPPAPPHRKKSLPHLDHARLPRSLRERRQTSKVGGKNLPPATSNCQNPAAINPSYWRNSDRINNRRVTIIYVINRVRKKFRVCSCVWGTLKVGGVCVCVGKFCCAGGLLLSFGGWMECGFFAIWIMGFGCWKFKDNDWMWYCFWFSICFFWVVYMRKLLGSCSFAFFLILNKFSFNFWFVNIWFRIVWICAYCVCYTNFLILMKSSNIYNEH